MLGRMSVQDGKRRFFAVLHYGANYRATGSRQGGYSGGIQSDEIIWRRISANADPFR